MAPRIFVLIALLVAAIRLYRPPWGASDLIVVPDSVEYAVSAQRFATLGRYDFEIEGVAYPPRYPPWFPVAVLAPAYAMSPGELGAGIIPVFLFALAGVLAAFSIGRNLAGDWGGAAAAALLSSELVFGRLSREIMTDVPATALVLWGCRLALAIAERTPRLRDWILAGLLTAGATALRAECAALILPYLLLAWRQRPNLAAPLVAILLPSLVLALANAIYQQEVFGDWRRNGYMFWCPVPCDYPRLAFSTRYATENLQTFWHPWLRLTELAGVFGTVVLLIRGSIAIRRVLVFAAFGVLPGVLLHVFFFYAHDRFLLPLLALACTVGGAGAAALLPERWRRRAWLAPALVAVLPLASTALPDPPPNRRLVAEALARVTPEDAVIVTRLDPVYLEPLVLRGTRRRIVPLSREVEYASKAIAWKRVEPLDPPALGPFDHRAPGLFRGGARDVCAFTADEDPARLAEMARAGIPVYFEVGSVGDSSAVQGVLGAILGSALEIVPDARYPWLGRIQPRHS